MALIKDKESEYSYNGTEVKDCYFMKNEMGYSVCLVNCFNKTVTPVHGYLPPNKETTRIKNVAKKLGYTYQSY